MQSKPREKIQDHFDNPRQVSERSGSAPGDMEIIARRDRLSAEHATDEKFRVEQRKRVLDFIRENPGTSKNAVRVKVGSVSGIDEWLKDGIVVEKNFGLYVV